MSYTPPLWERAEMDAFLIQPREDFKHAVDPFKPIADEASDMVKKGRPDALFVPMAEYVVSTALDFLNAKELPEEVAERAAQAVHAADQIVEDAVRDHAMAHFFVFSRSFRNIEADADEFMSTAYLGQLARVAFRDVQRVGGGALQFLEQPHIAEQLDSSPAEIIAGSGGLAADAGMISKKRDSEAYTFLGTPYIDLSHLRLDTSDGVQEVAFTDEAREQLRKYRGHGCPAHEITAEAVGDPDRSLLAHDWERIVHFLMPPNATANYDREAISPTSPILDMSASTLMRKWLGNPRTEEDRSF